MSLSLLRPKPVARGYCLQASYREGWARDLRGLGHHVVLLWPIAVLIISHSGDLETKSRSSSTNIFISWGLHTCIGWHVVHSNKQLSNLTREDTKRPSSLPAIPRQTEPYCAPRTVRLSPAPRARQRRTNLPEQGSANPHHDKGRAPGKASPRFHRPF